MSAYAHILELRQELWKKEVKSIVPEPEDEIHAKLNSEDFEEFKRRVSFAYIKKIRDPWTFGVLAVNIDKYGIPNYIGPNTFAEIAVAFAQSKKIYVLYGFPEVYENELAAWGAVALYGNLQPLVKAFVTSVKEESRQLRLI